MTRPDAAPREKARAIFEAGLRAADPEVLLGEGLHESADEGGFRFGGEPFVLPFPEEGGRLRIFGAGKAAGSLARALEKRLTGWDWSGRILVKHGHGVRLERIVVEEGGHPLPDEDGLRATERMLSDLDSGRPEDRLFFLLTGGASALLVAPAPKISLADKVRTTDLLLRAGATIRELNAVRKHLSAVKGGRLLERMAGAPVLALALVVSDVIGDDLSAIGSGPLTPDPTTFEDCLEIVGRYEIESKLPSPVAERLRDGARGLLRETPKPGDPLFRSAHHVVLANNRGSLAAAEKEAASLGLETAIFGRDLEGDVHEVATAFARRVRELRSRGGRRGRALLAGGELTLEVRGQGRGGRNQEFALVAARELAGVPGVLVLSAGTDGTDGPTDAAGAFADGGTWERASNANLDPERILAENDSYRLFDDLGDLLRTGPTGTNVNDLVVGLVEGE